MNQKSITSRSSSNNKNYQRETAQVWKVHHINGNPSSYDSTSWRKSKIISAVSFAHRGRDNKVGQWANAWMERKFSPTSGGYENMWLEDMVDKSA